MAPHLLQMQFLVGFLDQGLTKSCKVTRTSIEFDDQIIGNRIFKVRIFKIFRGQSTWTPLDGSCLWLSTMELPSLCYAPWLLRNPWLPMKPLIQSENILIFRETIVNTVDQKLKSGDVDDYYLLVAAIIYSHEQVCLQIMFSTLMHSNTSDISDIYFLLLILI